MYITKVMSDVMKSGPTYVGTKCPYCTYNLFGQVFMYGSYVREGAEGEVGLYILCIYIVRTSCAAGLSGWTERGLYVRVARVGCAQIFWKIMWVYIIYILYTYKLSGKECTLRALYGGKVRKDMCGIYCIYILYVQVVRTSALRVSRSALCAARILEL